MMFSPKIFLSMRLLGIDCTEVNAPEHWFSLLICLAHFTPPDYCVLEVLHPVCICSSEYNNGVTAEPVISTQIAGIASVSNGGCIDLSADFPLHNLTFPSVCSRGLCCETEDTLGRIVDLVSSWKEHHQLQDLVLSFWAVVSIALAQAALCKTLIPVFSGLWSVADLLVQGEEQWVQ